MSRKFKAFNKYSVLDLVETFEKEMAERGVEPEPYLRNFYKPREAWFCDSDSDAVELVYLLQHGSDCDLINFCLNNGIKRPTNETPDYRKALRKICRDGSLRHVKRQNWE
jgi:hypothetical protein